MVLVRLRINLPFGYISNQAGISKSTANLTFHKILDLLYTKLHFLIHWKDCDNIRQVVQPIFKQHFPRLTCIIDYFEIFIDRPVNLKSRAQVYSNYKKQSTVKCLIFSSPLGAINFLSNGQGSRATDTCIVRKSGFISNKFHCLGDQQQIEIFHCKTILHQAVQQSLSFQHLQKGKNSCLQRKLKLLEKLQVFEYTLKELQDL